MPPHAAGELGAKEKNAHMAKTLSYKYLRMQLMGLKEFRVFGMQVLEKLSNLDISAKLGLLAVDKCLTPPNLSVAEGRTNLIAGLEKKTIHSNMILLLNVIVFSLFARI